MTRHFNTIHCFVVNNSAVTDSYKVSLILKQKVNVDLEWKVKKNLSGLCLGRDLLCLRHENVQPRHTPASGTCYTKRKGQRGHGCMRREQVRRLKTEE